MKIILEPADLKEPEVIIRGEVGSLEVVSILQMMGRKNTGKLLLYREEEQHIVDVGDMVYLAATGNKVTVYTRSGTYEARQKLYELKELLDGFVQINKSTLVNMEFVKSIQAEFSGNYRLNLKDRKETLTISRKYFKEFKEQI